MAPTKGLPLLICFCVCITTCVNGFTWCIIKARIANALSWSSCAQSQMQQSYNEMRSANCKNCDKYFHCMGNYNAVYSCQDTHRVKTARIISDCRDDPNCTDADCKADRAANNYGRNGGNCASRYLCSYNCKYSPVNRTCKKSNCN